MGKQIYEKSCKELLKVAAKELGITKRKSAHASEFISWFANNYPLLEKGTIRCHLCSASINDRNRIHYTSHRDNDLLFKRDNTYRIYNPKKDPRPIALKTKSNGKRVKRSSKKKSVNRKYWWVNQNRTYERAYKGGYLWSPQKSKNGRELFHWKNMTRVSPGDIIFSYADKTIKAIGVAESGGNKAVRPIEFERDPWERNGWRVDVKFKLLSNPIKKNTIIKKLGSKLTGKKRPVNKVGGVKEGYLFELDNDAGANLFKMAGPIGSINQFAKSVSSSKSIAREIHYWALQGNPKFYDIDGAINNLDRDWWMTGNSNIKSGDRLVFWQSKDAKGKRGVVGFGVAIGNPVKKSGDIDNIYWTKRHEKKIKEKKKRIQVRYVKIKKPIWEDSKRNKALLNSLTVCGGQGTSFHVTEEQWKKLLKIAKIDERPFETEEVRIEGGEVAKLISIDNASIEHSDVLQESKQKSSRNKKSSKPKTYRRSKQPKQVGDWAEEFVLKFLQNNPKTPSNMKQNYPPLNPKKDVIWTARAGDKPGYDLSYTSTKGKTVGVEVKGTVSKKMTSFELTSNEWKKAQKLKSNYVIALVSSVGKEKTGLQFIVNPYKQLDAEPSSFECRIYQK